MTLAEREPELWALMSARERDSYRLGRVEAELELREQLRALRIEDRLDELHRRLRDLSA